MGPLSQLSMEPLRYDTRSVIRLIASKSQSWSASVTQPKSEDLNPIDMRMTRLFSLAVRYASMSVKLCAILLLTIDAVAQPTPRDLTGTVTDRHHEPLAGAVVQVHDENTDSVISYITPRTGRYSFKRLSSDDDYTVVAIYRGYRSKSHNLSKFDSKTNPEIRLVIKMP